MQTIDDLRRYLVCKAGVTEDYPFGPSTLALRVGGKIFALTTVDKSPLRLNLKCDPDEADALRAEFRAVLPGYHMNKQHWNTVILDDTIPDDRIREMVDESYCLVVAGLKKADRVALLQGN